MATTHALTIVLAYRRPSREASAAYKAGSPYVGLTCDSEDASIVTAV